MPRSLAFYRRLGLGVPPSKDGEPHVEATLPGGLRMAWDTADVIRSFDPEWTPPSGGHGLGLAFLCESPAEVDATCAALVQDGHPGHLEPWGAFWGQRCAVVRDPDGNSVDLRAARVGRHELTQAEAGEVLHLACHVRLMEVAGARGGVGERDAGGRGRAPTIRKMRERLGSIAERVETSPVELAAAHPDGVRDGGQPCDPTALLRRSRLRARAPRRGARLRAQRPREECRIAGAIEAVDELVDVT